MCSTPWGTWMSSTQPSASPRNFAPQSSRTCSSRCAHQLGCPQEQQQLTVTQQQQQQPSMVHTRACAVAATA